MTTSPRLILDHALGHAARHPDRVYLTQPVGDGRVVDLTWGQVVDEARRMAAYLRSLGQPRGARVAILSKNCAHFIMAELAIWMAGHSTVAIFPTETADTVKYVLEHSEASLLFVGKLDTWPEQQPGVPAVLRIRVRPSAGVPSSITTSAVRPPGKLIVTLPAFSTTKVVGSISAKEIAPPESATVPDSAPV